MPRVTGHTTYAPSASVVVLQEGVLHAAVLSARGACQCAGLAGAQQLQLAQYDLRTPDKRRPSEVWLTLQEHPW